MKNIRTDLALEANEYFETHGEKIPEGIQMEKQDFGGIVYTDIRISTEEAAEFLGKSMGTYITIEAEGLRGSDPDSFDQSKTLLASELKKLLEKNKIAPSDPILVVGLGNWDVTPDALGPKVISTLFVSRHLFEHLPHVTSEKMRPVSAISPGVLGITGIETVEIVKGIVEKTGPKCVIAIDALVSRNVNRLGKSFQISDSGIHPGSGVGNNRKALNQETLGVPVISIGVPTVVDAATIADDVFESAVESLKEQAKENEKIYSMFSSLQEQDRYLIFKDALNSLTGEMIVTPKEVDDMISDIAAVISGGLNQGLHSEDVNRLLH